MVERSLKKVSINGLPKVWQLIDSKKKKKIHPGSPVWELVFSMLNVFYEKSEAVGFKSVKILSEMCGTEWRV